MTLATFIALGQAFSVKVALWILGKIVIDARHRRASGESNEEQ